MSAGEIVSMMEEFESIAKEIEDTHPIPAYYVRLYYLIQASNLIGSNKTEQILKVKKFVGDRITKLETDKKKLTGDVKSETSKRELVDLVEQKYNELKDSDENSSSLTMNHVKAYQKLEKLIQSLDQVKSLDAEWWEKLDEVISRGQEIKSALAKGQQPTWKEKVSAPQTDYPQTDSF